MVWFFPLSFATVVIHELGHLAAAAAIGARILGVSFGFLHVERRRFGVRLHWRWWRSEASGMAFAVPDFRRSVRRQMLVYAAGGPLANVLAAAVLLPVAWPGSGRPWTLGVASCFSFGVLNAAVAIVNLMPIRRVHASDGWVLWSWWRDGEEEQDARRVLELMDFSLRGVLASEIPRDRLDWFDAHPDIGLRFFGRYVALRAAQECGDDPAFASILGRCRQELAEADAETYQAMRSLWMYFQIEQEFSQAVQGEVAASVIDPALLKYAQPYLRHRLSAARSRARKDQATCRLEIGRAERDLEGVLDTAARRSEPALLDWLRAP